MFFSRLHFSSSTDVDDIDIFKYSAEEEEPFTLKSVRREENTIEAYSDHVTIEINQKESNDYRFSIFLKSLGSNMNGFITLNDKRAFSSIHVTIK